MTSIAPATSPMGPDAVWDRVVAVQAEMARLAGIINAAEARLTAIAAEAIEDGLWMQAGVMSPQHWAAWQLGLSPARAAQLVAIANRRDEVPATMAKFDAGLLSVDQVAAVVRLAPAARDAEVAEFAEQATVSQLRRTLARCGWGPDKPEPTRAEKRTLSFGSTDDGTWRMSVSAPVDEGARIEAALTAMRKELIHDAEDAEARHAVTWLDALLGLIDRAVENDDARVLGRRKRHLVHLHLQFDDQGEWTGHLHMGPLLSKALLMYQTCDTTVQPILEQLGLPVSVGHTQYTVPDRTRVVVEHRDRGCRIPGCSAHRVEVHHIIHWLKNGPTDTWNLVCLCPRHHRLHHLGTLGIRGNADDPNGLIFTDEHGRVIADSGRASPPGAPPGPAATQARLPWHPYIHGTGETLQSRNIWFGQPATDAA